MQTRIEEKDETDKCFLTSNQLRMKDRELNQDWNWYKDEDKAWLVITPMWFCIINWTDWAYNNLENKKYILEKKYEELVKLKSTFNL